MKKNNLKRNLISYLALFGFALAILYFAEASTQKTHNISYDKFMQYAEKEQVTKIEITAKTTAQLYQVRGKLESYDSKESFVFNVPLSDEVMKELLSLQKEYKFELKTLADPDSGIFAELLRWTPILLAVGLAFFFITRQLGNNNKSMDFGRSKAKLNDSERKTTFNDVAGLMEEKEELEELIDFLKNPKKFQKLGARIPKGVLLVGPPGTGKTLLAKSVAGEAKVPFYYISGSEFVELFVGVGASRVRDMFKQAKQTAPCLIFIDEIDAVGRQRGTGLGGGHDEREQTLNQLLTEMDGFGANEGIIIIAATNRPDVLDPALLRPGRFDRQVTVNLPDTKAREEILEVHARGKIFAKNVNLSNIAKRTMGFSGADLENLLNEAALLAVRREKNCITMSEIDEAHDRVQMGPAKKSKKYTDEEKKLVAYHEAGHAVVGLKLGGSSEVQKITIIPRGYYGGYTMYEPKEEKFLQTKKELLDNISCLLGGRIAEEVIFDEVTTGAYGDFKSATKIARAMVTEYGMSSLGPIQFENRDSSVFLGRDYNKSQNYSSQVAFQIDEEIRKIIEERYSLTKKIIEDNKKLLDLLVDALLEHETLTKEQIDYLVENGTMPIDEDNEEDNDEEIKEVTKQDADTEIQEVIKTEE